MKFKPLEWTNVIGAEDSWFAKSPVGNSGELYITFEQGKYWCSWDIQIPGQDSRSGAMKRGQASHEAYLSQFMEG